VIDRLRSILQRPEGSSDRTVADDLRLAIGRLEARLARGADYEHLQQAEFRVFSQWGEDGILQYLVGKIPIPNRVFVEFGVEDYRESNTRFLLCNDNWSGLIIDAADAHARFLAERGLDWKYDITALTSFITRENIDGLIREAGVSGDIGLLSIDLDGNDYWILEAIECVSPRILVVEYNSHFGPDRAVTIPYRADFRRTLAHFSNLYYGASLCALRDVADRKGYALVGSNSAGNNAFFVRRDVLGTLREVDPADGWVRSRFRESRGEDGRLTMIGEHRGRLEIIANLPVIDVRRGIQAKIAEIFGLPPAAAIGRRRG
jgi:hypothetical protein